VYICVWRYPVNFSVHYNIHYITFTILVRETWNDYPIFCNLKFHAVYTCTFFRDTICLSTKGKMIKIVTLIDLHITYCIYIWLLTLLFSLQYLSESCFGNDNTFILPNPWVVLFFIYPTFYSITKNFVYPTLFSSVPPPPPPPPPRHK
jgi:hypothetical protein